MTFDLDGESGWLCDDTMYRRRLTTMSEGRYGAVRGTGRILDLLAKHEMRATFFIPGTTIDRYPDVVKGVADAGHEIAHHGHEHLRNHVVSHETQREEILRALDSFERHGLQRPVGYRSPAWEMTPESFDILIQEGFLYDSSCMGDDRPYLERVGDRDMLELPVHWSLDDWPRFGWSIDGGGNMGDPAEMYRSWKAEYENARNENRTAIYTMHPEVTGRPYRLHELDRLMHHIRAEGQSWVAPLSDIATHVDAVRDSLEVFTSEVAPPDSAMPLTHA